ncbi:MAG: hypothetical protein U1D69_14385, partial [Polynucleobacter sp.]|nr:hypothetical protein [Polynucleobacter sp.]
LRSEALQAMFQGAIGNSLSSKGWALTALRKSPHISVSQSTQLLKMAIDLNDQNLAQEALTAIQTRYPDFPKLRKLTRLYRAAFG